MTAPESTRFVKCTWDWDESSGAERRHHFDEPLSFCELENPQKKRSRAVELIISLFRLRHRHHPRRPLTASASGFTLHSPDYI